MIDGCARFGGVGITVNLGCRSGLLRCGDRLALVSDDLVVAACDISSEFSRDDRRRGHPAVIGDPDDDERRDVCECQPIKEDWLARHRRGVGGPGEKSNRCGHFHGCGGGFCSRQTDPVLRMQSIQGLVRVHDHVSGVSACGQ